MSGEPSPATWRHLAASEFRERAQGRLAAQSPGPTLPGQNPLADSPWTARGIPAETIASARDAAVLVPVVDHGDGATILLTRRTGHMRKHSGQIAFPGGKIDGPHESPLEAALREAEEEIGLVRRHIEPIGFLDPYYTGSGYRIVPVIAIVTPPFRLAPNPDEVDAIFEAPLGFLMNPGNHHNIVRKTDGRQFIAMPWGEHYIWGATAGMLRKLYETLYA